MLRTVTVTVPSSTIVKLDLPDGSHVELNSGSQLSYRRFWLGRRQVQLEGEAFFTVVSADAPFVVNTFNATVEVIGTRFNVRAWREDLWPETVVVLESGEVVLAAQTMPERVVRLKPGQMSHVPAQAALPGQPVSASLQQLLAWRQGGFAFNNQPLGNILAELERRFGVAVEAPLSIAQDSLVLFMGTDAGLEDILQAVSGFRGYQYRITESGYELILPAPSSQ